MQEVSWAALVAEDDGDAAKVQDVENERGKD